MKKLYIFSLIAFMCLNANAQLTSLIPAGSSWKYLANGSNQGTAWRATSFNDASWPTGNAQLGYGDGDEATVVSYGTFSFYKHVTTYFRKTISIATPSAYTGYTISLLRDDGAVVYVNGTQVILSNMPTTYGYTTLASTTISSTAESAFTTYAINSSAFVAGNNVIAVEIHQRSRSDADISFNLKLEATSVSGCGTPSGLLAINITTTGATLNWNAVSGATGYNIRYRVVGAGTWLNTTSTANTVNISSLTPGTNYEFGIQANCNGTLSAFSTSANFSTLQSPCGAPSGLTSTAITTSTATINWSIVSGATGYNINYRIVGAGTWTNAASATASLQLSGLIANTSYEFRVQAVCSGNTSTFSSTTSFTTQTSIPLTDSLILANSSWKYFDSGTTPATGWKNLTFTETGWKTGNAELGYGDGGEATVVSYGSNSSNKFITTYFRKTFSITNVSVYTTLSLDVVRDDGIVVYINGNEVWRNNLPSGTITNSTLASAAIGGTDESAWNTVSIPTSALVNGSNIIAVELHQNAVTSTDISFNARLTGYTGAVITRGPYLQMLLPTGITIRWRTNVATNSKVDYGTSLSYGSTVNDAAVTTEHIVTLNSLTPQTKYFYRIGSSTQVIQGDLNNYFRTAIPTGTASPLRIWVTGDFGNGSSSQAAVRDAFASYTSSSPAGLWLWLGDNAYNTGTENEYQSYVFNMYPNQFKNIPVYPSIGNHDYGNAGYQGTMAMGTSSPYFSIFTLPQAGEAGGIPSGTEKYYSYNNANIHFIVIDSYGSYNTVGSPMYNWLLNDLASNTQRWTIVYFHHPPYSKGSHNSDSSPESVSIRQNLVPLFDNYHVDLVLNGHSHNNERSYLIHNHYGIANTFSSAMKVSAETNTFTKSPPYEGTVYAVCGTSGQNPGSIQSSWPMQCMYFANNTSNCSMIIDVDGDLLNAKYLTSTGTIVDQFTITKTNARTMNEPRNYQFEVYTDMDHNNFLVSFDLDKSKMVDVKVFDPIGRLCSYPVQGVMMDAGRQELEIGGNLPAGIYLIQLQRGNVVSTRKLFKPD